MKYALILLLTTLTSLQAAPRYEVSGQLLGYESAAEVPVAFRVTTVGARTATGQWREFVQPTNYELHEGQWTPTAFSTERIGYEVTIQLGQRGGEVSYFGEVVIKELVLAGGRKQREFPVLSAHTPFKGFAAPGGKVVIPVTTPRGKAARLELTLKPV